MAIGREMELAVKARTCIIYFEKGKDEEKRNPEEGLPEWCISYVVRWNNPLVHLNLSEMHILSAVAAAAAAADLLKSYYSSPINKWILARAKIPKTIPKLTSQKPLVM
jgi:hypothetical protein